MAKKNIEVVKELILRLSEIDIFLSPDQIQRLINIQFIKFNGFECLAPNQTGEYRFGININKDWFLLSNHTDKPSIKKQGLKHEIDVYLFPTNSKLFGLHYLNLIEYADELEQERNKWFQKQRWGLIINEQTDSFHWVDNTKEFPLVHISSDKSFTTLLNT